MSTELRRLALRTFSLAAVHLSLLVARGGAVMPAP